jgi:alkyldihydroxyacetonephosphate synthase
VELEEGEACMFFVAEGPPNLAKAAGDGINEIAAKYGAKNIGSKVVDHWLEHRNDICDTIGTESAKEEARQTRTFYSTCEISASWSEIKRIYQRVMKVLPPKIDNLVLLGGHVSHSYQNGTNIYFVYQIKANDPLKMTEEDQWKVIENLCREVLEESTGGICHHHGVGKARVKMIKDELGSSYALMRGLKDFMDPNGIMNPGNLLPLE